MKCDVLTKLTINKVVTWDVTHDPGDLLPLIKSEVIWWEWFRAAIQGAPAINNKCGKAHTNVDKTYLQIPYLSISFLLILVY